MSMWLILAKVEPGLLDAVRKDPQLLAGILGDDDEVTIPADLAAAFDTGADRFEADYRTLSAIAEAMPAREWFDKATGDTEALDYDEFTYGSAFALSPADVSDVAAGLIEEGWYAAETAVTQTGESQAGVAADPEAAELDDTDLAVFFVGAAAQGRAIVGGIN